MYPFFKPVFRFLRKTHIHLFPIAKDWSRYRWRDGWADFFAGLNVALVAFPQAMVYALMAGLPIEYGLFGVLLASLAAAFFSGSRVLSMGPTNSTAVAMLTSFTTMGLLPEQFPQYLPTVLILSGIFLMLSAFLNIASLVQYISKSVIVGYMYAVILMMIFNQIHNALGFDLEFSAEGSRTFLTTLCATFMGLKKATASSIFFCILSMVFFYSWKKWVVRGPMIAVTVFFLACVSYVLIHFFKIPVHVLHPVYVTDWHPSWTQFSWAKIDSVVNTAFILSLISLVDGTTILKTLSARMGKRCNVNQMVFGMGWANLFCGMGNGMPSSCSLVRSTTNYVSGARTSVASLFAAAFCFLGILFFGPFFHYVPKAGLATLIILLGFDLFERRPLRIFFKTSRSDTCVFLWTCLSSFVLPLNVSIFGGILLSIVLFLKKAAVPSFSEYVYEGKGLMPVAMGSGNMQSEVSILHVEGNLFFGSAELFRDQIRTVCKRPQLKVMIVKLRGVFFIDATCLLALEELLRYMKAHDRQLILTEVSAKAMTILQRSGLYEMMGADHIFLDDRQQTQIPTLQALQYAKTLLGDQKIVVRLLKQSTIAANETSLQQSIQSLQK